MLIILSTCSCLEIRMQDEVNINVLEIVPLTDCKNSNTFECSYNIKFLFLNKFRERLLTFCARHFVL